MVKISQLQEGDIINVIEGGLEREGVVCKISREEEQALVDNGIQEFWYSKENLHPLPITEERLVNILGFVKEETPEGVKYRKGPFRVIVRDPGNYTDLEIWYREDRRQFKHPIYIHELQNHHLDMVKMPLERI
jgi:hypothetical protein